MCLGTCYFSSKTFFFFREMVKVKVHLNTVTTPCASDKNWRAFLNKCQSKFSVCNNLLYRNMEAVTNDLKILSHFLNQSGLKPKQAYRLACHGERSFSTQKDRYWSYQALVTEEGENVKTNKDIYAPFLSASGLEAINLVLLQKIKLILGSTFSLSNCTCDHSELLRVSPWQYKKKQGGKEWTNLEIRFHLLTQTVHCDAPLSFSSLRKTQRQP